MHTLIQSIIRVLDGTSAEYGKRQRGQSLVETAFMIPILLMLLAGLVEVGWFANNYLILLESARVGARLGTGLVAMDDPVVWESNRFEVDTGGTFVPINTRDSVMATGGSTSALVRSCRDHGGLGFYARIACFTIESIRPLSIDTTDNTILDDVVVSVFSVNVIPAPTDARLTSDGRDNLQTLQTATTKPFLRQSAAEIGTPPGGDANSPQAIVTGRFPANANECDNDHRDPFDINDNSTFDVYEIDQTRERIMDPDNDGTNDYTLYDAGRETQRGFAYTGKWQVEGVPGCVGSEWNIDDVERLMNLRGSQPNQRMFEVLPDRQGFVLVEIFDRHDLLLNLPGFSPMFDLLGGEQGTYIRVWAIFPVPAVEFALDFNKS